jgi:ABC-type glycerol-3-phosphate transport system substrate-binding protein
MKSVTKRLIGILFIMVLLISAVAYGATKDDQKITVTILAGESTTDAGLQDIVDKAVAAKYPNITLQWEAVDWGKDFHPKMQQYIQSGLPDILIGKAQDVATYGSQGLLADMNGKSYLKNVLDAAIPGVTIKGKTYGMVFNCLYQGVYYNRKLFAENGIKVPATQAELATVISKLKAKGITPFATHMVDTWSIGNITMQFAINDVFNKTPNWGDQLRAGKVSYATSAEFKKCYEYNKLIYDNTWNKETFSLQQTDCDARMVQGKAGMKVSGSWSIQNFMNVDPKFDFGIFPFPNQTGDAKLIFEPNMTWMKSAKTKNSDAVDKVLEVISSNKKAAIEFYNQTKTASMLKGVSPTFPNPSQKDIDLYASKGKLIDANSGNNQLQWGGFQEENAKDIASWLQGTITLNDALKASDSRKANSKP